MTVALVCISPVAGRERAIGVWPMVVPSAIAVGAVFFAVRRFSLNN
jgi:hypothetical protein